MSKDGESNQWGNDFDSSLLLRAEPTFCLPDGRRWGTDRRSKTGTKNGDLEHRTLERCGVKRSILLLLYGTKYNFNIKLTALGTAGLMY